MKIKIQFLNIILLFLSAIAIPLYFTDLRLNAAGVILRFADLTSLAIISLFCFLRYHKLIRWQAPVGYNFVFLFVLYCLLLGLLKSGIKDAITESIQWVLLLGVIGIIFGQSKKYPREFQNLFIKALLSICALVVIYHFSIGKFYHYKSLGDAKYILALTGVVLVGHMYLYNSKKYLLPLLILYPFILLSLERKGILAFHTVTLIYLMMAYRHAYQGALISCSVTIIVSVLFAPYAFDYSELSIFKYNDAEIFYLDEEAALWVSDLHRQSLLTFGWDIFQNNMLLGTGPKMLPLAMRDYFASPNLALYTHNVFLDLLIEYGVLGFILLILPYFVFAVSSKFNSKKQRNCFICLLMYSFIMLFFMSSGAPSMLLFYFPLCMGFIFSSLLENINNTKEKKKLHFKFT